MRIIEIQEKTPLLIRQLMELWEKSVRETHLFLPDSEIENIKEYIPQALREIPHLIVAENENEFPVGLWGLAARNLKCCSASEERGKGLGKKLVNMESKLIPSMNWP